MALQDVIVKCLIVEVSNTWIQLEKRKNLQKREKRVSNIHVIIQNNVSAIFFKACPYVWQYVHLFYSCVTNARTYEWTYEQDNINIYICFCYNCLSVCNFLSSLLLETWVILIHATRTSSPPTYLLLCLLLSFLFFCIRLTCSNFFLHCLETNHFSIYAGTSF